MHKFYRKVIINKQDIQHYQDTRLFFFDMPKINEPSIHVSYYITDYTGILLSVVLTFNRQDR